jgi:hypothetical protein
MHLTLVVRISLLRNSAVRFNFVGVIVFPEIMVNEKVFDFLPELYTSMIVVVVVYHPLDDLPDWTSNLRGDHNSVSEGPSSDQSYHILTPRLLIM